MGRALLADGGYASKEGGKEGGRSKSASESQLVDGTMTGAAALSRELAAFHLNLSDRAGHG